MSTTEILINPERRRAIQAAAAGAAMTLLPTTAKASPAPAPVPLLSNASIFRFRIGAFRALALSDGQATWPAFPTYASNTTEDELKRSLAQNHMDPVNYTLNFNALYVDTGRHRVLIDTGAGGELGAGLGQLAANLTAAGVAPAQVDAVVLSHGHPDHIGGIVGADGVPAFPNAQFFVAETEWRHWRAETIDFGGMTIPDGFKALFRSSTAKHLGAIGTRVTQFQPGAEILPGISTIACHGHTAGHVAVRIASGRSTLIHVGDAFHSQAFDLDNPNWATAFPAIAQYLLFLLKRRLRRRPMDIVFLLYPGMTALDLVGPHEVLSRIPGARILRIAEFPGAIETDSGLVLTADLALADVKRADILVVPGASDAWPVTRNVATMAWLRQIDATTTWTTSVCTGALILGAAGLLHGHRATTFWSERETLRDFGAIPIDARVVESGKVMTGAGVSAGIDLALALVDRIAGRLIAQGLQLGIEYDPAPPFEGGSPAKTPAAIVEKVRKRIEAASTRGHRGAAAD